MSLQPQPLDKPNSIHYTNVPDGKGGFLKGFTCNPSSGCAHGCQWLIDGKVVTCYAKTTAQSQRVKKFYPQGFASHYWKPERLQSILKRKKPAGIFIDSMGDLMGTWLTDDQINQCLDIFRQSSQHTLFLLTKNAPRLLKFNIPDNVWVGVSSPPDFMYGKKLSDDQKKRMLIKSLKVLQKLDVPVCWLSAAPLSWDIADIVSQYPGAIQWCVIEAGSARGVKYPPKKDHLRKLIDVFDSPDHQVRVYMKNNLHSSQWAHDHWREEFPRITDENQYQQDKTLSLFDTIEEDEPATTNDSAEAAAASITPALNTITNANSLDYLRACGSNSVHTIITSPPYFAQRDYGYDGQVGLEMHPKDYIKALVEIFHEAKRVLKDDGTFWLNIGDNYVGATSQHKPGGSQGKTSSYSRKHMNAMPTTGRAERNRNFYDMGFPMKSLYGTPWRLAFALQDDGWILRCDLIWHRPSKNESVKDRPTHAHEYLFMFSKNQKYYYDRSEMLTDSGANIQSVWKIGGTPSKYSHCAPFPEQLITPIVRAGCPEGGTVLDMFMGSGTTAFVAKQNQRNFMGCDLSQPYIDMANKRLAVPIQTNMFHGANIPEVIS